jgi:predicted RNA-binding protein with PUA-like domain
MNYWLIKSEPDVFSIDDLASRPGQTEPWDGVRNYQARNMMRDDMRAGDPIFFYHSNCKEPGIVGLAEVVREGYPDHTAQDPNAKYHDPKASADNPRWFMVDIKFIRKLDNRISLKQLKDMPELEGMPLVRKGNRLSVMPVAKPHWDIINSLI